VRRGYKFRIYPTAGQASRAGQGLRDHQRLCNAALEERREAWRMRKVSIRYGWQSAQLKGIRALDQDQGRWSFSSQQAPLDRWDSVEWPSDGDACRWKPDMGRVYLQGIGHIKVHAHRAARGRVKTISLKREGRRWYVVLSCDDVPAEPLAPAGREIGLDAGVARFATTSDGAVIPNPRFGRKSAGELAAAQQVLARKKRGSSSRRRAKAKTGEVHRKIRNRRAGFHHMTRSASGTLETPGTNVAAKSGLNKSILDTGWSQFAGIPAGKAEEAARRIVLVNPAYTSIDCYQCGRRCTRPQQDTVACPVHGGMDADCNGALNIYARAGLGSGRADAA